MGSREHNILMEDIGASIIEKSICGNAYSDHKENCDLLLSDIMYLNKNISIWIPDGYESPKSSESPVAYKDMNEFTTLLHELRGACQSSGFFEEDENKEDNDLIEDKENEYANYFDSSNNSNIVELLGDLHNLKQQVQQSIPETFLNIPVIYLCRINTSEDRTYRYTVGFTQSINDTLETMDETFVCGWKIEILILLDSKSQDDEVVVRYNILTHCSSSISNNTYAIDNSIYSYLGHGSIYKNPFYSIDAQNNETYLGKKITHYEHTSEHIN